MSFLRRKSRDFKAVQCGKKRSVHGRIIFKSFEFYNAFIVWWTRVSLRARVSLDIFRKCPAFLPAYRIISIMPMLHAHVSLTQPLYGEL